jgi:virginiamycin B lyase
MALLFVATPAGADLGILTEVDIPSAGAGPSGIVSVGGALWFTEYGDAAGHGGNRIGRLKAKSGRFREFPVPTTNSGPNEITFSRGFVWFTEDYGNQIGRINSSGKITEFAVPTGGSRPYGISAGPDHNVWFTEYSGGNIGRITPKGMVTESSVPSGSSLYDITSARSPVCGSRNGPRTRSAGSPQAA